ncbi:MAG: hypothetical protein QQN61_03130 [Nitrosopumilus sp.]
MTKDKVIHARIDEDTHDKLFEKCNELGCSFTDYIQSVIESSLEDDEVSTESLEPKITIVDDVPELKNVEVVK